MGVKNKNELQMVETSNEPEHQPEAVKAKFEEIKSVFAGWMEEQAKDETPEVEVSEDCDAV